MTGGPLTSPETQRLPGVARLGSQLEITPDSAIYEAELDHPAGPAIVEIRPGGSPQAAQRLKGWQDALLLAHPHLLKLYAAGETVRDEAPAIYLVSERADESLAGVLQERSLSEQETRELLEPILSALVYLHGKGFAHTAIEPGNVNVANDTLKLSSGTLQRIDGSGDPAEDMHAVGVLLVQALTRSKPELEEDSGPYILREASEPLSGIVRHCLDPDQTKRWTAEQALAFLSPETAKLQPKPADSTAPTRAAPNQAAPQPEPIPQPPSVPRAKQQPARPVAEPTRPQAANRKWLYVATAALLLITAAVGLSRRKESAPPALPASDTTAPIASVPRSPEPAPSREPKTNAAPAALQSATRVQKPLPSRSDRWEVVVASYGARGPAEKRAHELAKRWPKFHPEVFQPPAQKTRYLVIVGKNLSQAKADALSKRAHAAGLPHDTYIKLFE